VEAPVERADAWPASSVDDLPVGLAELDRQGRLVRGNAAFAALLDLDGADLVGRNVHDVRWPAWDGVPGSGTILDRLLAGHPVDRIFPMTRATGQAMEVRVRAVPIRRHGQLAGGSLVVSEIPVELANQHSLGREADAYRLLADHLVDIVLVTEADVITWVSPSVRRTLGYDPDRLVGSRVAELVHPDDDRPAVVTEAEPTATIRHRLRRAEGGYRWFDTNVAGRFDPDGTLIARYGTSRDIDERIRLEGLVDTGERHFREALDASPDGFAIYRVERDPTGAVTALRLVSINAAGAAGYVVGPLGLIGRNLIDFSPGAKTNGLWDDLIAAVETGLTQRTRVESVGDSWPGVLDGVQVRLDDDLVLSTWRDVTETVRAERLLAQAYRETAEVRATLHTALDATSDGFLVFELDRAADGAVTGMRIIHANAASTAGIGAAPEDVLGRDPREVFPQFVDTGLWDKALASVAELSPRGHRIHLVDDAGEWTRSIDNTLAPVGADRVVLTFRDVTQDERARREQEEIRRRAVHSATHDALTGLANRVLFRRDLEEALTVCPHDELVGVVFCDLDGFKQVNDTHGHAGGDAVLKAVAQRLQRLLRRHDTAARLAGDEFVLLLRHLPAGWTTEEFITRTTRRLQEPVWIEGALLTPSASLGIALADPRNGPDSDRDADALLAAADHAMYITKAARRLDADADADADADV
jgi:diguanylate cyclase (GGDEF)-like protein/PAS domain S-box-containing protein